MLFTPYTVYSQFDGDPPQPTWTVHGSVTPDLLKTLVPEAHPDPPAA
jgi:hypothetical protein